MALMPIRLFSGISRGERRRRFYVDREARCENAPDPVRTGERQLPLDRVAETRPRQNPLPGPYLLIYFTAGGNIPFGAQEYRLF
jgi:hypothetical protein